MAFDTLRSNKMRSALTILGVVIGITSIVGMTSLIRGFDESLRDMIRQLGPNTIIVSKASAVSLAAGADFSELIRRPNLTVDDARAIERLAPSVGVVDIWMGQGLGGTTAERVFYGGNRTPTLGVIRSEERRVGKECRSLCDWSSDVCSSDLAVGGRRRHLDGAGTWWHNRRARLLRRQPHAHAGSDQIGRASCRERV